MSWLFPTPSSRVSSVPGAEDLDPYFEDVRGTIGDLSGTAGQMQAGYGEIMGIGRQMMDPYSRMNQQQFGLMKQQGAEQLALQNLLAQRQSAALGQASGITAQQGRTAQSQMGRQISQQFQQGLAGQQQAGAGYMMQGQGLLGQIGGIQGQMGEMQMGIGENLAGADIAQGQALMQAELAQGANISGMIGSIGGGVATAAAKAMFFCIPKGVKIDTPNGSIEIEKLNTGDEVIGYDGSIVNINQKHEYKENPKAKRFLEITFNDNSTIDLCDMHRIEDKRSKEYKVGDTINNKVITNIKLYDGIETSYDLLTSDKGYRISGISVNSMIEEMMFTAYKLSEAA
jgi:hypothetical protein